MNEQFQTVQRRRIRCLSRPGPSPIVFIHGMSRSADDFRDAFDAPALREFGLLAPDLLGHGQSDKPADCDYSLADQTDLVAEIARSHGLGPATIVAHSMGAAAGVLMAQRHPDLVSRLVLAEGNLTRADAFWSERIVRQFTEAEYEGEWLAMREDYDRLAAGVRAQGSAASPAFRNRLLGPSLQCPHFVVYRSAADLVARTCPLSWLNHDLAGLLQRGLPVHSIYGDATRELGTSPERLEDMGIATHTIPRAGHMMMLDNPDHFFALVAGINRRR
jgi:pimeloyl-ACP methyl ester carboxylesterase